MDKKYAFGLIGCGRIGSKHAEHINNYGNLIAVCDTDKKKADEFAKKFGVPAYYTIDDLLKNSVNQIDIMSVCTPNGLHAEHSIQSLKAGLHVLCEKPLAITAADCKKMISTAKQCGKQLFVVKQNRFNPPVQAVKRLLDEKFLGKIYSVQLNCFWNRDIDYYRNTWHGTKKLDGGILFTQFSHFIDLLYWFFGDVIDIKASGNNFSHGTNIEFDDTVVAIAQFQSGILGTMHFTINAYKQNMEGSLTIFGEKGTVKIGGQYLNKLEYQLVAGVELQDLPEEVAENNYGLYKGSMSNHHLVYQNIINVLKGRELPIASITDGLKSVEIIEEIYSASKKNLISKKKLNFAPLIF